MDNFSKVRLTVVVILLGVLPMQLRAATLSYSDTLAQCRASISGNESCVDAGKQPDGTCVISRGVGTYPSAWTSLTAYRYMCGTKPAECAGILDQPARVTDPSLKACDPDSLEGSDGIRGCMKTFVPKPGSFGFGLGDGPVYYSGVWKATGGTCTVSDGVPKPKPVPVPEPKVCGGGSCIEPSSGKACIVTSSGQQFCTPVGAANPDGSSNCYTDGSSSTLCTGAKPPLPNPPPITPVSDPATDINASDKYAAKNPSTGSTSNVTVNNYTSGSTSGAKPGDVTQGGSSSGGSGTGSGSGNDPGKGSFSGGTDCTTPPVCTGDAVLCGSARSRWALLCQLHKDVGSDEPKPDLKAPVEGEANKGDLWGSPGGTGTGNGVVDSVMAGNFDMSGFGIGTKCPMEDLQIEFNGQSVALPLSKGCIIGPWLRGIVIAFALFWAAMIMSKGN